jgi:hypothetical protein
MAVALCGLLGALTACSSGSSYVKPGYNFNSVGRVAVIVSMSVGYPPQRQEIADLFAMHILQKGYDVIDRANVPDLAQEVAFQNTSGITSPDGREKLAIHNVSTVVVVNMAMQNEEDFSMTAKMLDVQTGTLLWAGEGTGDLKGGLATFGGAVLGAGAGAAIGSIGNTTGAIVGGVAGALAGGTAGAVLQPNMAQLLRSVIRKTCRDLPARTQVGAVPGSGMTS